MKKKIITLLSLIMIISVSVCACGANFGKDVKIIYCTYSSFAGTVEIDLKNNSSKDGRGITAEIILFDTDSSFKETHNVESEDFLLSAKSVNTIEIKVSQSARYKEFDSCIINITNINGEPVDINESFDF